MNREREAIVVALEALEAGDAAFAVEVLLAALEDGTTARWMRCADCGLTFAWPGEVEEHRRVHAAVVV